MNATPHRRSFLKSTALLSLSAAAGGWLNGAQARAEVGPVRRVGGPKIKLALNAYSFNKLLNGSLKTRQPIQERPADGGNGGFDLLQLVDFCARQGFDGLDPTGYFFPGYPDVPSDAYVNAFKRRAFDQGIGISGTGVRNNLTTADKTVRAASVRHIKEWVEVAARLGAPVLRVFADTQMKGQTWETVAPDSTRDQVEQWIADDVRECAEHGKKFGVIIGVQNHGDFLKTADDHLSLIRRVDSEWCGPIVDTGYYKTDDPYRDIAAVAPYAVNWQVKESPFGVRSEVRTDSKRLLTIIRLAGYRGYLPIETLSVAGKEYDPFDVVPRFQAEVRAAVEATADVVPPVTVEEPPAPPVPPAGNTVPPAGNTVPPASGTTPALANPPDSRPDRKPPNRNKNKPPSEP